MPLNHIVCCDGTNNAFGAQNTNVIRLIQALDRNPEKQRVCYDPGVGTLPDPLLWNPISWIKAKVWRFADLAIGWGLEQNVLEAYSYLMDHWSAGDRVFLFGFSRGAYTVRVLAGMLHTLGLVPRGGYNLLPYVMNLYKSIRNQEDGETSRYWRLCREFRETFSREAGPERRFPIHFLGVWDTVSSYGWFFNPTSFPHTASNPSCVTIRHAIAIDERRAFFRQNLFHKAAPQDLRERWFPGVHSDVGGGYQLSEGGLWRPAFEWMLEEATEQGLLVNQERLDRVLGGDRLPKAWLEPKHESLTPRWWPAEFVPKKSGRHYCVNRFQPRAIPDGSWFHRAAVLRLRDDPSYRPKNVTSEFVDFVRALIEVPAAVQFHRDPPADEPPIPHGTKPQIPCAPEEKST